MRNAFRRQSAWAIAAALTVGVATSSGVAQQSAQAGQQVPPQRTGPPFPRVPPLPFPDRAQVFETLDAPIRVVPIATGLVNPWSFAFLPDGSILVTERPGRLRIIRNGKLDEQPIPGVPEVATNGQAGLMEVTLHPRYAENRFVYLTYSKPGEGGATTALARGRFDGKALADVADLFVADNWSTGGAHFGSKLVFGPDGMLYMSVGERNERKRAQDTSLHGGKILRLKEDGTVPPDNPFVGKTGFRPEIYTYGHRNVQGLAFDADGTLWATEHGPQGGDELNRIVAGKNYGWPVVTYGREYTGEAISASPHEDGIEPPVVFWVPSLGLSGLAIYDGDRFPGWKGNFFAGGLSGLQLQRVVFNDRGPIGREALMGALRLRVRDVRQGPDGLLYVSVDGTPGGLLRIEPASSPSNAR
jgi:glucose/arabinose dehydrogenase